MNQLRAKLTKCKQDEVDFTNEQRKLRGEEMIDENGQVIGSGHSQSGGTDGQSNDDKSVFI